MPTISSRYTDLEPLASSDYTQLFRALDTERDEQVLVRIFRTQNEAEQSFILTEAAALARLALPQIASMYDLGMTDENEPYCAFENVPYIPLDTVPSAQFAKPDFVAAIAVSLLRALAPLHAQWRALLCLSSASIRLADVDVPTVRIALDTWIPLANEGFTRAAYGQHNVYAAPELLSQRTPDARADLYSLGVALYEAVTGQSFAEFTIVDAPGMVSHLVMKLLRDHAPTMPDALAQWLYALMERDRSMRFFSAQEALEYLAAHGLTNKNAASGIEPSPVSLLPVSTVGLDTALGAVVNIQSPFVESPVLEISGQPGLGKTMLLRALVQSRLQSTAILRQKIVYMTAQKSYQLSHEIEVAFAKQEPTLFLVDDAEQIPDAEQLKARELLAREDVLLAGIRVVATHRSQLALLAAKPTALTLSHFAPTHVPLFCTEILGRCAFTPDFYKYLYAVTKGHPLFLETLLRSLQRGSGISRRNRIWTNAETGEVNTAQTLPQYLTQIFAAYSEEALSLLAALLGAIRALERSSGNGKSHSAAQGISLHILAELLDASTQSTMRRLLPLVFDGTVRLHNSVVEFAHEFFRDAASACCSAEHVASMTAHAGRLIAAMQPREPLNDVLVQVAVPTEQLAEQLAEQLTEQIAEQIAEQLINEQIVALNGTEQTETYRPANEDRWSIPVLAGNSKAVLLLRKNIVVAASHDVPYLIESSSQDTREELALLIHTESNRRERPFHTVSCADFTPDELDVYLFGGELFGGEKQPGLLTITDGSTVLLDDIGAAGAVVQARLARLLQSSRKQGRQAGQRMSFDMRIACGFASSEDEHIDSAVRNGTVHRDLYFAVSSVRVQVPSLADRAVDVPQIAHAYTKAIAAEYHIAFDMAALPPALGMTLDTALSSHLWSGEMAELEAVVRSLVLHFDAAYPEQLLDVLQRTWYDTFLADVRDEDDDTEIASAVEPQFVNGELLSIDDAQKQHILRALERTNGNKTKAAEMLAIKRTTLLARMKKFGLMP
jgi:DNA-binding NtrC family response regulator/serine/threonine protein kinase